MDVLAMVEAVWCVDRFREGTLFFFFLLPLPGFPLFFFPFGNRPPSTRAWKRYGLTLQLIVNLLHNLNRVLLGPLWGYFEGSSVFTRTIHYLCQDSNLRIQYKTSREGVVYALYGIARAG